ncbi:MAG: hypothetical protein WA728_17285 [Xanthobacteraceae bacterium]
MKLQFVACWYERKPQWQTARPSYAPPIFGGVFARSLRILERDGPKVLERIAKENPSSYFSVCARLLPSDVSISIQAQSPALDASDLAILRAIKQAIPDAGDRQPGDVFNQVLEALKANNAKLITSESITEALRGAALGAAPTF